MSRANAAIFVVIAALATSGACSEVPTSPSAGNLSGSSGSAQTVTVYLNNGDIERYAYEGFTNYPTSIRENGSCTSYSYSKGDLSEIRFHGRTTAACSSNVVYWEITIGLNGRSITGHYGLGAGGTFSVSGTDLETGRSKSVSFTNISRIVFNR
jgi:hypothetical protein